MAITVEELVNIGSLGTRVLAGSEGLDRGIGWAHVCELAAPWEWLGDGDLVMTTGLGIPESPSAQDEYVRRLAGAGVVGVAVGENMYAPPLTPRMYRCADRVGLPLLLTRYEVPFAAMARTIAAANGVEELDRLSHALRVFEHLHLLVDGEGEAALMQRLESEIGCRLHLLDARSLRPVAGSSKGLPASLVAGLAAQPPDPLGRRPSVLRLPEAQGVLVVPVPGPRRLLLVAIPDEGTRPDLTLLHHVTTVLSLEQVTVVAQRERSRRLGASLLAQIVDGRVDPGTATDQLASVGLVGRCVLTASRGDPESDSWAQLHHVLDDDAIPHLLLTRSGTTIALLPDGQDGVERLLHGLPSGAHTGVSEAFESAGSLQEAHRQARWALHLAEARDEAATGYSDREVGSPFLPGTLEQSREVAMQVLGGLLAYDEQHDSTLLLSLRVFLEENRSWQRAAARLHVHKQTLVYRVDRVEQLTGRRLSSTADVSELWLALQAGIASGVVPT